MISSSPRLGLAQDQLQRLRPAGQAALDVAVGDAVFATLAASQRVDAARAESEIARLRSMLQAALGYLELAAVSERVRVHRDAVAIAERLAKSVEEAVGIGRAFAGQAHRARAEVERHRLEMQRAEELQRVAAVRLATRLRLDPRVELRPVGPWLPLVELVPETSQLESLVATALRDRPELEEAAAGLAAAEHEHDGAVWGPLVPVVSALASDGGFGPVTNDLKSREEYSLGVWWRIGPGGLFDLGRISRSRSAVRTAELQRVGLEERIVGEVVAEHASAGATRRQLDSARRALDSSRRALEVHEQRDALGISVPLELIEAQRDLVRAELDEVTARTAYSAAQYRLWVAVGAGGASNR